MNRKSFLTILAFASLICLDLYAGGAAGGGDNEGTIGGLANNLKGNFTAIGQLILATAQVAGVGFTVASIFKFKQHKDNPTQVQIGTPFALLAIGITLMFLKGLFEPAAKSVYGDKAPGLDNMFKGEITSGN